MPKRRQKKQQRKKKERQSKQRKKKKRQRKQKKNDGEKKREANNLPSSQSKQYCGASNSDPYQMNDDELARFVDRFVDQLEERGCFLDLLSMHSLYI